ncbi:hypothetical protein HY572_02955 [Candidatus Micrarchaeota archaeon]|nr:hypothetical protein [Candidatus Micrarchaeota archaeon]
MEIRWEKQAMEKIADWFKKEVLGETPKKPALEPTVFAMARQKRLSMEEALFRANQMGYTLFSNKHVDELLEDLWQYPPKRDKPRHVLSSDTATQDPLKNVFPVWTGTLVAYVKPGKSFVEANKKEGGRFVAFKDPETGTTYKFPVPEAFRNERNAVLVLEHGFDEQGKPFFAMASGRGNTVYVAVSDETNVKCVYDFPSLGLDNPGKNVPPENRWFLPDARFGIPQGQRVDLEDDDARELFRSESGIHLIARDRGEKARDVMCSFGPSWELGVIASEVRTRGF